VRLDDLSIFEQSQGVSSGISEDTVDMDHKQLHKPLKTVLRETHKVLTAHSTLSISKTP
jgi:hypothetical protein